MKYIFAIIVFLVACSPQKGDTGATGKPGVPGAPGVTLAIKAFCPDKAGEYKGTYGTQGLQEYYIQVGTQDYAVLDGQGNTVYLTLLYPGNYQTSDNSGCNFTVNADGSITEH